MEFELLADDIRTWASELGFQQVGITDTDLSAYSPQYRRWLARRFNGSMAYMARNTNLRERPESLTPGTLRVISARMNYLRAAAESPPDRGTPGAARQRIAGALLSQPKALLDDPTVAYVARYALGRDYHKTVRRRLVRLAKRIEAAVEGGQDAAAPCTFRAFTDSAPVLEKPLAEKAGLGWIGKNTLLLNRDAGSFFFLGEIYTNLPLPIDAPEHEPDGCGNCRACLNVCPTGAIVAPRELDARRCISYLTIESKDAIPEPLREAVGNRIFGCDDCQLICPWNRYAQRSDEPDFSPRHGLDRPALARLLTWDEDAFLEHTRGSALRRVNYSQWLRNLAVAAGNAAFDPEIVRLLRARRVDADGMVREHIDWALARQHADSS